MDEVDAELLRKYVQTGSGEAFGELVRRHAGLVYGAAFRQVRDAHRAEDIAQAVFLVLARKAAGLEHQPVLAAWLLRATRLAALEALRKQRRREHHERKAAAMRPSVYLEAAASQWKEVEPFVDEALAQLSEGERRAVVLRFYERKTFAEVGQQLGIGEEAARKRVERATGKLRVRFGQSGVALSAATVAGSLYSHLGQAAPAGVVDRLVQQAAQGAAAGSGEDLAHQLQQQFRLEAIRHAAVHGFVVVAVALVVTLLAWQLITQGWAQPPADSAPAYHAARGR